MPCFIREHSAKLFELRLKQNQSAPESLFHLLPEWYQTTDAFSMNVSSTPSWLMFRGKCFLLIKCRRISVGQIRHTRRFQRSPIPPEHNIVCWCSKHECSGADQEKQKTDEAREACHCFCVNVITTVLDFTAPEPICRGIIRCT